MPQVVLLMLAVVTVGAVQSLWQFGFSQDTMRACRYAVEMPLTFFLGANMITSSERATILIRALLIAAILAAVQHVLFVGHVWWTQSLSMESYHLMRTIGFSAAYMPAVFLLSWTLWKRPMRLLHPCWQMTVVLLFVASVFLNQTRSLWIAMAVGVFVAALFFRASHRLKRVLVIAIVLLTSAVILTALCRAVLPGLDPLTIAADRTGSLLHGKDMGTRQRGFQVETREWFHGSLVFGRGLAFYQDIHNPKGGAGRIAFAHLGYITYLSQLGLIGLLVHGLYLPLDVLRSTRRLWTYRESSDLRYLGLLGGISVICLSIMFAASSHFLAIGYEAAGILYGAAWVLSRRSPVAMSESESFETAEVCL